MKALKRFLPKTLFARALLILVLPTLLVQMLTVYIFYERHWDNVTRHMANALAGEIAFFLSQASLMEADQRQALGWMFGETTGIRSHFEPSGTLIPHIDSDTKGLRELRRALASHLDMTFAVYRLEREEKLEIRVQLLDGVMTFRTSLKRLESGTTSIFVLWMIGAAVVFSCIAILFLRNQVRPIRQLALAAESFGKGQEIVDFKPHGAQEVRRAARAFLVMRERILRQIRSRTEMLAGISHDLRTPLTRMKLQLALLENSPEMQELQEDVTQMEHMIAEYLEFARGEGSEESTPQRLSELLRQLCTDYRRQGAEIPLEIGKDVVLDVREGAFRRMMHNLIDNALNYGGGECRLSTHAASGRVEIYVDDKGGGIPDEETENVFHPFTRLDAARNLNRGGVGLGLTIARDVARSHGGNITLAQAPGGGLRVVVRLPR